MNLLPGLNPDENEDIFIKIKYFDSCMPTSGLYLALFYVCTGKIDFEVANLGVNMKVPELFFGTYSKVKAETKKVITKLKNGIPVEEIFVPISGKSTKR